MRIAVTGAGGFLGTWLLRELRSRHPGAAVAGVVRRPPPAAVEGVDYADAIPAADVLYHLAGTGDVAATRHDPAADLEANAGATLAALDALHPGATLVLASSCAVYGDAPSPAREDGPVLPRSHYGVSKLAAEQYALRAHRTEGADVRIARIANPYGPGQRRLVVWDLARQALRDGRIVMRGSGRQVRDLVHAADVAAALAQIGERGEPGSTYNVGSGQRTTIREVAELIAAAAGVPGEVDEGPADDAGKVPEFLPDVERLRGLGFAPSRDLPSGIEETVAWIAQTT